VDWNYLAKGRSRDGLSPTQGLISGPIKGEVFPD